MVLVQAAVTGHLSCLPHVTPDAHFILRLDRTAQQVLGLRAYSFTRMLAVRLGQLIGIILGLSGCVYDSANIQ